MKKASVLFLAVFLLLPVAGFLCFSGNVNANENMKFDSEAKKLDFIRQMLSKEKNLRIADDDLYTHPQYCSVMMKDLLAGKNFKAIEPDVLADSEDDPKIAKWLKCDGADYHDYNIDAKRLFWGLPQLGSPPYRYYRIELDGNPKNGLEDMIYHEMPKELIGATYTGYTWVNLSKCEIKNVFRVTTQSSTRSEKPNALYLNTLVRYNGRLWVVDFLDGFDFEISRWRKGGGMYSCPWLLFQPEKSE